MTLFKTINGINFKTTDSNTKSLPFDAYTSSSPSLPYLKKNEPFQLPLLAQTFLDTYNTTFPLRDAGAVSSRIIPPTKRDTEECRQTYKELLAAEDALEQYKRK
ncbi:MAG: hypothetical protein VKJ06_05060 [Vampirovibrionales bacterium]|nr:hypothetical protein [Vampirovibrionales bacterium]